RRGSNTTWRRPRCGKGRHWLAGSRRTPTPPPTTADGPCSAQSVWSCCRLHLHLRPRRLNRVRDLIERVAGPVVERVRSDAAAVRGCEVRLAPWVVIAQPCLHTVGQEDVAPALVMGKVPGQHRDHPKFERNVTRNPETAIPLDEGSRLNAGVIWTPT